MPDFNILILNIFYYACIQEDYVCKVLRQKFNLQFRVACYRVTLQVSLPWWERLAGCWKSLLRRLCERSLACHCEQKAKQSRFNARDKLRNLVVHNDLKNRDCRVAKSAPRNDIKGFFSSLLEPALEWRYRGWGWSAGMSDGITLPYK